MDPGLYKAAMEGDIEMLAQHEDQLGHQLTPRNNTVLHVAAQFQDNGECVKEMLIQEPSLLWQVNSKGETALHIAARRGCSVTVKEQLAFAKKQPDPESDVAVTKELLRMATSEEKDTALHEAVRNNHLGVVELLLEEGPDLSYAAANSAGETPLYLAAERHYHEIVSAILRGTCRNQAYGGPNGRTALHAAVIADCSSCVKKLLGKDPGLIKIGDSYGWTPLHFAARFNLVALTKELLDTDKSIAYLTANKDDKMTALHLAAKWGLFGMMEVLWSRCPDCWEMVNERGQNVLHIAIENGEHDLVRYLLQPRFVHSILLNEKDRDGNTPLHLLATSYCIAPELIRHPAADKVAFNKKNQTPKDVILKFGDAFYNEAYLEELKKAKVPSGWRNIVSDDKDRLENYRLKKSKSLQKASEDKIEKIEDVFPKAFDTVTLVATLVATVTFAASFTVPGGFDSNQGPNQGMAVLVRNAAFKAFVISNTIAVAFSISALLLRLISSFFRLSQHRDFDPETYPFSLALLCLIISLVAMTVSLITGSFAVLAPSIGLAVAVCAIGCASPLIFCVSVRKMVRDLKSLMNDPEEDPWVTIRIKEHGFNQA